MLTFPGPHSTLEIHISRDHADILSPQDLQTIVEGIHSEDMRIVTPSELAASYAITAAFDTSDEDRKRVVGYARQVQRDSVTTSAGTLCVAEIGSVWVDPQYRGQRIGSTLIGSTTNLMQVVGFIPVAVCNEDSRWTFESLGYNPIGMMPSTPAGRTRVVEMFEDHTDWYVRQHWHSSLRDEVLSGIASLPRFSGIDLLPPPALPVAM